MGKRKLHGQTYFQCDWTGLPMRQTNCYMPDWTDTNKLLKHGSYACWEAVVAHAEEQLLDMTKDGSDLPARAAKLKRIQEHIDDLVGQSVKAAPHWSKFAWFAKSEHDTIQSPKQFLDACCKQEAPVVAVRLPADGSAHEVHCDAACVEARFAKHLTKPYNVSGPPPHEPQCFQTVRKKANKERDLTVFYWPFKNGLPFNQVASNAFKMHIYGDALLVQQTKEPCFLPRERYVNYYVNTFHEQFTNKQKRKEANDTLSTEDYALAKAQMASELQSLEQVSSANASLPADLAKAAVLPPPSGSELANLLRAQGQSPPLKRPRRVEVEVA